MRMAARLSAMGVEKYASTTRLSGGRHKWNGVIKLDHLALEEPFRWKRPRLVFVNSMSDLFHEDVPVSFIESVFRVIRQTPRHIYQVLTKRAERLAEVGASVDWPSNLWMGVSIESNEYVYRADLLRQVSARTRFLSLEPLLGPLPALNLQSIDWVIVGGESGPGARSMRSEWVRSLRDRCMVENVAFHFKQWGGTNKKAAGRLLDGRTWDEKPRNAAKFA